MSGKRKCNICGQNVPEPREALCYVCEGIPGLDEYKLSYPAKHDLELLKLKQDAYFTRILMDQLNHIASCTIDVETAVEQHKSRGTNNGK